MAYLSALYNRHLRPSPPSFLWWMVGGGWRVEGC